MDSNLPVVLTVAGSDSGGGAGIQADLKTIAANGGYGLSVITSVTAQNTKAVTKAVALSSELIEAQFDALHDDFAVDAMKSGMLADRERVEVVAACLGRHGAPRYVLDPVMISKSGYPLLAEDAIEAVRTRLLPLATLVTPNVHEAQLLSGITVATLADAREAARRILDLGPQAVIVKGGHLEERPGTDVLITTEAEAVIEGEWVESRSTHGTGCTFSAAIATQLVLGYELGDAVRRAKRYLTEAIRHGPQLGTGAGPTDHFFYLRGGDPAAWLPSAAQERAG